MLLMDAKPFDEYNTAKYNTFTQYKFAVFHTIYYIIRRRKKVKINNSFINLNFPLLIIITAKNSVIGGGW